MIVLIISALALIPLFGIWGFLELKNLIKKEYVIESPDIPESLDGKKIALISDQRLRDIGGFDDLFFFSKVF